MLVLAVLYVVLGTPGEVIPIYTEKDLNSMRNCLMCSYALFADLAIVGVWTPVGTNESPFSGTFDGNGHSLKFSKFNVTSGNDLGLFGAIMHATVSHLRLESDYAFNVPGGDDAVSSSISETVSFGLLAGLANSSIIQNCTSMISSNVRNANAALTIGALVGTLLDSSVTAVRTNMNMSVLNTKFLVLGGLAGRVISTAISDSRIHTIISVSNIDNVYLGGIAAISSSSLLPSSVLRDTVEEQAENQLVGAVKKEGKITNCSANINIDIYEAPKLTIGGVVGSATGILKVIRCNVIIRMNGFIPKKISTSTSSSIGGALGFLGCDVFEMYNVFTNATFAMQVKTSDSTTFEIGGLIGYSTSENLTVAQSVAVIDIRGEWNSHYIGGLIGRALSLGNYGEKLLEDNGAIGTIFSEINNDASSDIGGLIGNGYWITAKQCYFIGDIAVMAGGAEESHAVYYVGGASAQLSSSSLLSSFALANISIDGYRIVTGAVALSKGSVVIACYASINIVAYAMIEITMGGMVGQMTDGSKVVDSFVLGDLNASGLVNSASIGGFIGHLSDAPERISITACYSWSIISVTIGSLSHMLLGGFIGGIEGAAGIDSCIVYGILSSVADASIGLLIGGTKTENQDGSIDVPVFAQYTVAYVIPKEVPRKIGFLGSNATVKLISSYCAEYNNTENCVPPRTLSTPDYLADYDFRDTFQLNPLLVYGSLAFKILPMPKTNSAPESPTMVMPTSPQSASWLSNNWVIRPDTLQGLPYLRTIAYSKYCGEYIDCHGFGISPLDAICSYDWSSPPRNTTSLISNLHRCNIFVCKFDSACLNNGACIDGVCKCQEGYTGPDCSELDDFTP